MSSSPRPVSPVFHIDVSASAPPREEVHPPPGREVVWLLEQFITQQEKTNNLLGEIHEQLAQAQKQRAQELGAWKQQNPDLARNCRLAAECLAKVQNEYLFRLTEEVHDNAESLQDGDFLLAEFVDRYGPRLAHLNGVLQVLSQLGAQQATTEAPRQQ